VAAEARREFDISAEKNDLRQRRPGLRALLTPENPEAPPPAPPTAA
jgi:hypothetical protein